MVVVLRKPRSTTRCVWICYGGGTEMAKMLRGDSFQNLMWWWVDSIVVSQNSPFLLLVLLEHLV
jgi:hypothetical protein